MKWPLLHFGTDGWRGIIGEEATAEAFERLAHAAANRYREGDFGPGDRTRIVIGHDPRRRSEEFAGVVAGVFRQAGIRVLLTDQPIPTPAVSFHVRRFGLSGGVAITASHNPARYNGFKLKAHFGGSASAGLYEKVEREIDYPFRPAAKMGAVEKLDLRTSYLEALGQIVDRGAIGAAGPRVLADAMHGAAGDGLERVLAGGAARVESFRADRDVDFGQTDPEPIGRNLLAASRRVREGNFDLAVAHDGDADRLGVLDGRGEFVSAHRILALLLLHAFRVRKVSGGIAKTFSTSNLINRVAKTLNAPLHETAIGFKYVAELIMAGKAAAGGEESGGYGFAFHLPERDGILSALLLLEYLSKTRQSLDEALGALSREFGSFEYARSDVHLPVPVLKKFLAETRRHPPKRVAGQPVTACHDLDGVKLEFGTRGWLLLRLSGTEPMIRLYCEHEDAEVCGEVLARARMRLEAFAGEAAAS